MSRSYTQTVVPVSRVPERFFGWAAWVLLLLLAIGVLIFSLTTARSEAFENNTADYIANIIVELDRMGPDSESGDIGSLSMRETFELFTTIDGLDSYQETLQGQDAAIQDFAIAIINWIIDFFNQLWVVALALFFPLFVGIFGLLTIRNRIVSGLLLTLTAIMTAPLIILLLIPGIIPMFFIIAAILLFVRKNKVITHEDAEINTVEGERKEKRRSRRQEKKEEARLQEQEARENEAANEEEPTKRRRRKLMQAPPESVGEDEDTIIDQSNLDEDDDMVVAEPRRSRLTRGVDEDNLESDYDYNEEDNKSAIDTSDADSDDDYYEDDLDRTRQFDARDLEEAEDVDQTRQFRKIEDEDLDTYDEDALKRRRRRREDEY